MQGQRLRQTKVSWSWQGGLNCVYELSDSVPKERDMAAKDLLLRMKDGAVRGSVKLKDVEEILSNDDFTSGRGLLTTTEDGNTLLHLAAACGDTQVLPLVSQAYKRAKLFPDAMMMASRKGHTPLHIAVRYVRFENVVLLYKDCQELCSGALQPNKEGLTLLHTALESPENLNMVKFLLSQEETLPLLLSSHDSSLPLDCAKKLVQRHEFFVKTAEDAFRKSNAPQVHYNVTVVPKKKMLEKAKELFSAIEQPTMEQKAEESKKLAKELQREKMLERQGQLNSEIQGLILAEQWQEIEEKYLLAGIEETQKITVMFLAEKLAADASYFHLPMLSEKVLRVLLDLISFSSSEELAILSSLKLLIFYTREEKNNLLIMEVEKSLPVLPKVLDALCSMDQNLQCTCATILSNFFNNLPANCTRPSSEDSLAIQPLLLIKHFSLWEEAKRLAADALVALGASAGKEPDPGTWSVRHVCFWMESNTGIESGSEYSSKFSAAGIDGLHLLELSSVEMAGLGVKYVSHQRKMAACIDDLRRRNMRSMLGKRDLFLSYAHIDIKFARKVKSMLNQEGYSVWIDEAGIRAGHKWRNEIADGIQNASCVLVILTPRSANSSYCQDEIALAEEYHKPILTIRRKTVLDMDPGLKLTLQRRQWLDFADESTFLDDMKPLVGAIHSIIGPGSGVESEIEVTETKDSTDGTTAESAAGVVSPTDLSSQSGVRQLILEVLTSELDRFREELRTELRAEISRLDSRLDEISRRVDWR